MIGIVISVFLNSLAPSPDQAVALSEALPRGTASADVLARHVAAARLAGHLRGVRPEKLLAIAWHESNFRANTVTREPGHRVSCGPMTPTPKRRCEPQELTATGGYLAGAEHYRFWLDRCDGSEWCADLAFAGGLGTVRACASGRRVRAPYSGHDVCAIHADFMRRERLIVRALGGQT